jgi:hypothetical protein
MPTYQNIFNNTIVRPETLNCAATGTCPSGLEEALKATRTAMDKRGTDNAGFFRDGADLAVVILSDEDERSTAPVTATTPQQVVDHFNSIWPSGKKFYSFGIIVQPGDTSCLATQQAQPDSGGVAAYGTYAAQLAGMTGGQTVSICAPDYNVTLQQIGDAVRRLTNSVELTRTPIAGSVSVVFNPAQAITWTVQGRRVLFDTPVPAGVRIDVYYNY